MFPCSQHEKSIDDGAQKVLTSKVTLCTYDSYNLLPTTPACVMPNRYLVSKSEKGLFRFIQNLLSLANLNSRDDYKLPTACMHLLQRVCTLIRIPERDPVKNGWPLIIQFRYGGREVSPIPFCRGLGPKTVESFRHVSEDPPPLPLLFRL